jgi:hypothetical protein
VSKTLGAKAIFVKQKLLNTMTLDHKNKRFNDFGIRYLNDKKNNIGFLI